MSNGIKTLTRPVGNRRRKRSGGSDFLGAHTIVPIDKTGDTITTLAVSVLGVLRRAVKALLRLRVKPEAVLSAMWAHKGRLG